jgi:regulator of replication initiation timing
MADYKDYYDGPYAPQPDQKQIQIDNHGKRIKDLELALQKALADATPAVAEFVERLDRLEENVNLMLKGQKFAEVLAESVKYDDGHDFKPDYLASQEENERLRIENEQLKKKLEYVSSVYVTVSEQLEALHEAGKEWEQFNYH